ncbi:MAG: DUF927 domain-containing protein, partial [Geminicoccaceae bacterium]|nr:DUF927 domain-containing protein [Geminicoccaceae bacterium]
MWYHGWKAGRGRGDPGEPVDVRICRPAWKVATTKTVDDGTFGVLVELIDLRGRRRLVALPCGALAGDGIAAVRELEAAGIQATHDRLLVHWLRCAPPVKVITTMRRTGWTPGFDAFVLPDRTIGDRNAMFAPGAAASGAGFASAGDFARWREAAALAVGNPDIATIVAAAFAAPLIGPLGLPSAGLHVTGPSGRVKTTPLLIAASAWGRGVETGGYVLLWSATANGVEAIANERCDAPLIIDEQGARADPRDVAELVYRLCGGIGRARARRDGSARPVAAWRTFLLSTAEHALESRLDGPLPAGVKGRLLELRYERSLVRDRHGFESDAAFARHVRTIVAEHYGHAGPAFVAAMLEYGLDWIRRLYTEERKRFGAASPVEERAANTFALLALAGELAIRWAILPWPRGFARAAAQEVWCAWHATSRAEADEGRRFVEALRDFIARHGASRFEELDPDRRSEHDRPIVNRAGWKRRNEAGEVEFLITPDAFKEALAGLPADRAPSYLAEVGLLVRPREGYRRLAHRVRIRGERHVVYVLAG